MFHLKYNFEGTTNELRPSVFANHNETPEERERLLAQYHSYDRAALAISIAITSIVFQVARLAHSGRAASPLDLASSLCSAGIP